MSEERKPMLSEDAMCKMAVTENGFAGENKYRMGRRIIAFYENLITTGKLRVVEEAEILDDMGSGTFGHCSSCGIACLKTHKHCPGCGNLIKR